MYGVDLTVYVPAGAVLLRAIWVKLSTPITELDESGDAGVEAPVTPPPSASTAIVAGALDTVPEAPGPIPVTEPVVARQAGRDGAQRYRER